MLQMRVCVSKKVFLGDGDGLHIYIVRDDRIFCPHSQGAGTFFYCLRPPSPAAAVPTSPICPGSPVGTRFSPTAARSASDLVRNI